jgi:hypothetical protein
MGKKASDILLQSASTLTEEEWKKDAYFQIGLGVGEGIGMAIAVGGIGPSKDRVYDGQRLQGWLDYYQRSFPNTFNRPLFLAHYYAAKVGLTFFFNDAPSTTYEQVIAKLHEASKLAALEGD